MRIWVCPRVNSAEPCVRGEMPTSVVIGRISSVARPSGPALVDRDLLADEVLVERVRGLLHVRAGEGVLHRLLAVADRERELHLVLDAGEQDVPLAGLELLRVLLRVGQRAQVVLELGANRALDGREPLGLEQHREPVPHLRLADDVLLARVHRDRGRLVGEELVDDRPRLTEADLGDPAGDGVSLPRLELGVQLDVDPLRLADLTGKLVDRVADADDLGVRERERLEHRLLRHLVAAGLDHRQRLARPDDDEVERGFLHLLERRVDDELALDPRDAHRADRPEERQRRDRERRRGAVDREDVVRYHHVGGEHGADDLHLVLEALRPERPDRAVDHARGERRALGGAALPLEEAAGDLPGGVHPLLDVDRQREEVRVWARVVPADGRREDHRVAASDDDRAVRLLRELARLEAQLCRAHVDGHRGLVPGGNGAHTLSCPFTLPLWRKVEV